MDEFDIKVLKANGYSFIDGGIVDSLGNYKSEIVLNDKTYKSESSYELWYRGQLLEKKYSKETKFPFEITTQAENEIEAEVITSNKQNELITSTVTIEQSSNISDKTLYKYSLVLVASLIFYIIIKKLIK